MCAFRRKTIFSADVIERNRCQIDADCKYIVLGRSVTTPYASILASPGPQYEVYGFSSRLNSDMTIVTDVPRLYNVLK